MSYYVIQCSNLKCSRFSYCKIGQKTKTCPYCGRRINIEKIHHKVKAETAQQARKLVPLNTKKQCFIRLNPPSLRHEERVKLTFHINENRILTVDAIDLKTGKPYYENYEIARLK